MMTREDAVVPYNEIQSVTIRCNTLKSTKHTQLMNGQQKQWFTLMIAIRQLGTIQSGLLHNLDWRLSVSHEPYLTIYCSALWKMHSISTAFQPDQASLRLMMYSSGQPPSSNSSHWSDIRCPACSPLTIPIHFLSVDLSTDPAQWPSQSPYTSGKIKRPHGPSVCIMSIAFVIDVVFSRKIPWSVWSAQGCVRFRHQDS